MIISYNGMTPKIAESAWIADNAVIAGNVEIGENCSVWFGAVVRGEDDAVIIGNNTNIQDNCSVHCDEGSPAHIGDNVTIGHNAVIHGCTIENNCMIGMGSVVLNDAHLHERCLVGAGALITEGKEFEADSLILGSPAKAKGPITEDHRKLLEESAGEYITKSKKMKLAIDFSAVK